MRTNSLLLLMPLLASACLQTGRVEDGVFALTPTTGEFHQLRYSDGQSSPNDSCMIRLENGLNPKIPPVYINGRPMGFC